MGTGYRAFLVDRGDRLHRISQASFDRLALDPESMETIPDAFVGEDQVRYILAFYETYERKPSSLLHVDYGILPLTAAGTLDHNRRQERMRLIALARLPELPMLDGENAATRGSVLDGTRVFAEKRLKHEWEWQPSDELQDSLHEAIFGTKS